MGLSDAFNGVGTFFETFDRQSMRGVFYLLAIIALVYFIVVSIYKLKTDSFDSGVPLATAQNAFNNAVQAASTAMLASGGASVTNTRVSSDGMTNAPEMPAGYVPPNLLQRLAGNA